MMKKVKWILFVLLVAGTQGVYAQQQAQQVDSSREATNTPNVVQEDQNGSGGETQSGDNEDDGRGVDRDADAASKANTDAMGTYQSNTSSSGSPAVLSGDNGRRRDGTNTVQRATANMAGSPVAGYREGGDMQRPAPQPQTDGATAATTEKNKNSKKDQPKDEKDDKKKKDKKRSGRN